MHASEKLHTAEYRTCHTFKCLQISYYILVTPSLLTNLLLAYKEYQNTSRCSAGKWNQTNEMNEIESSVNDSCIHRKQACHNEWMHAWMANENRNEMNVALYTFKHIFCNHNGDPLTNKRTDNANICFNLRRTNHVVLPFGDENEHKWRKHTVCRKRVQK